jgi:hypothetical protein
MHDRQIAPGVFEVLAIEREDVARALMLHPRYAPPGLGPALREAYEERFEPADAAPLLGDAVTSLTDEEMSEISYRLCDILMDGGDYWEGAALLYQRAMQLRTRRAR